LSNSHESFFTICQLRASSEQIISPPLFSIYRDCAESGCVYFILSPYGHPIGYIVWANASKESVVRYKNKDQLPSCSYEFNEGYFCLLIDILVLPQWRYYARAHINNFLKKKKFIVFNRRGIFKIKRMKS